MNGTSTHTLLRQSTPKLRFNRHHHLSTFSLHLSIHIIHTFVNVFFRVLNRPFNHQYKNYLLIHSSLHLYPTLYTSLYTQNIYTLVQIVFGGFCHGPVKPSLYFATMNPKGMFVANTSDELPTCNEAWWW